MIKLLPGAMIVGAFSTAISLGSIVISTVVSIGVLVTLFFGVKYKVVADAQRLTIANIQADRDTWQGVAEGRAAEIATLHDEKQQALHQISTLKEEKARLEALPNLSIIIDQMSAEAKRASDASSALFNTVVDRFAEMMRSHEEAAASRHQDLIKVLGRELGQKPQPKEEHQ